MVKRVLFLLAATLLGSAGALRADAGTGTVILATTTSTQDSGLLDALLPLFQKETGITVKTIAVGSGQALAMGRKGEADLLLVHSPDAEKAFMAEGSGSRRRLVMHNDFVLVGPPADPAGVRSSPGAAEAFRRVAAKGCPFVSRADQSGTHAEERKLWTASGVDPAGRPWYLETGLGMGQTLNVAAEKKAYTLSDRGTYLSMRKILGMAVLSEGDPALRNIYHVIELSSARHPRVHAREAGLLADFLLSPRAQDLILRFGMDQYGTALFFPDAGKADD